MPKLLTNSCALSIHSLTSGDGFFRNNVFKSPSCWVVGKCGNGKTLRADKMAKFWKISCDRELSWVIMTLYWLWRDSHLGNSLLVAAAAAAVPLADEVLSLVLLLLLLLIVLLLLAVVVVVVLAAAAMAELLEVISSCKRCKERVKLTSFILVASSSFMGTFE